MRNHRREILRGFSKPLRDMVTRDGVELPTPAFSGQQPSLGSKTVRLFSATEP